MAALQQTYSGDLSQSIASNIGDIVGDAAQDAHDERNRIEAEITAHNLKHPDRPFDPQFRKTHNVLGHEIKGGDFFGSALKHRFTPNPLGLLGERFHKKDFVGEAHLKGQSFHLASPVGPFPKPRAAWSAKMAGQPFAHVAAGADLKHQVKHQVQQQQPTSNPAKGTSPLTSDPKQGFSNTRKKEVLVRDKKLGQFLTAVFQSLSASLLSLNRRMGDNEEALADAKNGMFATQKALEDNSDMLGSKLDSIITALREQNNEIVRAEDNREVRDRETNIEREKDQSDTERIVKLSQDAEEVEEKNQQDEIQKLLEEQGQQMELPINTGEDGKGFAEGGIASGPDTGYLAVLHGDEAIVPLDNNVTQGERPAAGTKSIVDMPMLERGNNPDGMKPRVRRLPSIFPKSTMVGDTFPVTGGSDDVSVQTEHLYKAMQLPIKASTIVTMGLLGKILANSPMAGELREELRQTFSPLAKAAGVDNTVTRSIEKRTIHDSKKSKEVFKEDSFVERTEERQWWNLFGRFRDWVNDEGDGDEKKRGGDGIGGPATLIPPPRSGGPMNWWNTGRNLRVPMENTASIKDLFLDDISQITRSNKAFSEGAKGIRGWRPLKAFSGDMLKTGPTPAVRQFVERPLRFIRSLGSIRGGLLGLILNDLMNPQSLADGTIEGNREIIELLRSQGEDVSNYTSINSPALTGVRSNLVKNESEQNIFTKMERRQAQFDINPSIYTQDSASSEEVTEVSAISIKGDPGLSTYYPPSY